MNVFQSASRLLVNVLEHERKCFDLYRATNFLHFGERRLVECKYFKVQTYAVV